MPPFGLVGHTGLLLKPGIPPGPVSPLGPVGPNEVLRLEFEGTNGSTTYVDTALGKTVTNQGTCSISTLRYYDGLSSLIMTGNDTSYVVIPNSADFNFGTGDFELKLKFYPTNLTGFRFLLTTRASTGSDPGFFLVTTGSSLRFLAWGPTAGVTGFDQTGGTLVINAWNTASIKRVSGTVTITVNGTVTFNSSGSGAGVSFAPSSNQLFIGKDPSTGGRWFAGHMDSIQIAKGGVL